MVHRSGMFRFVPLGFMISLGACVANDASVQIVASRSLRVAQNDAYYWPAGSPTNPGVEVFPLTTALVVSGTKRVLGPHDEADARKAADAHCRAMGKGPSGPSSRFADNTWAFAPCTGS